MNNLFVFLDNFINGYFNGNIELISILSILCGIFVIISKNPIISVLFLIGLFLCVSGYLMFLGLNFIALSYLLVYVGAVSILFLFILMLINIRISELQTDTNNSLALALIIGIIFYYCLYIILPSSIPEIKNTEFFSNIINLDDKYKIFYVSTDAWDNNLIQSSHITTIGNALYTNYFMWLVITSIILLLAMIGAIIITIRT